MRSKHNNLHHKRPRSCGGCEDSRNVKWVNTKLHCAWHRLFQNYGPARIADLINRDWLDPEFKFIVVKKKGR